MRDLHVFYLCIIQMQSHIQKIIEKPQVAGHQPLSRRQSHNVNVEDIIRSQVSTSECVCLYVCLYVCEI